MPEVDVEKWIKSLEIQIKKQDVQIKDLEKRVETLEGYHGEDGAWSAVPQVEE